MEINYELENQILFQQYKLSGYSFGNLNTIADGNGDISLPKSEGGIQGEGGGENKDNNDK